MLVQHYNLQTQELVCVCVCVCACVLCVIYWGGLRSSLWIGASSMLTEFEQRKGGHNAVVRKGLTSASRVTLGKSPASLVLCGPLLAERKAFFARKPFRTQKRIQCLFSQLSQRRYIIHTVLDAQEKSPSTTHRGRHRALGPNSLLNPAEKVLDGL